MYILAAALVGVLAITASLCLYLASKNKALTTRIKELELQVTQNQKQSFLKLAPITLPNVAFADIHTGTPIWPHEIWNASRRFSIDQDAQTEVDDIETPDLDSCFLDQDSTISIIVENEDITYNG